MFDSGRSDPRPSVTARRRLRPRCSRPRRRGRCHHRHPHARYGLRGGARRAGPRADPVARPPPAGTTPKASDGWSNATDGERGAVGNVHPYGMRIAPLERRPDLPSLAPAERDGLARMLIDVFRRLHHLFDQPMPYMFWIHQRPTDGRSWREAWMHIEVVGPWRSEGVMRFVAAGELGGGRSSTRLCPGGGRRVARRRLTPSVPPSGPRSLDQPFREGAPPASADEPRPRASAD